jgi:hypothetical protein
MDTRMNGKMNIQEVNHRLLIIEVRTVHCKVDSFTRRDQARMIKNPMSEWTSYSKTVFARTQYSEDSNGT